MKVLVFDGDCAFCRAVSRGLVAWGGVPQERRRSHLELPDDDLARLLAAGLHDELAVLDEESGEARAGVAGILWWLRDSRFGWAARLLDRPALRALLVPPYRLVAYNRRVIAPPPPGRITCACDPSPHPGYQAAFAAILGAAGVGGAAAAVAAAASALLERPLAPDAAPRVLGIAAVPLVVAAVAALRLPPGRRIAGLAHGLWPGALAAGPFLFGATAWHLLPAPAGGVGLLAGLAAGLLVLAVCAVRRGRLLASWRA